MDELKLTDSDLAELREAFFQQAGEILENLNGYILAVEKEPVEDNWKSLKRAFHTLKGDSRAMGFHNLASFAHKAEDLIEALRQREPERASIDLLLRCADAFGAFIDAAAAGKEPDISGIAAVVDAYILSSEPHVGEAGKTGGTKCRERGSALLKIEPERVDRIMDLVGEMVIGRSMLSQLHSEIGSLSNDVVASRLYSLNSSFERTLSELQKSVMKVRMLPVDIVFRRFPRLVRDMSDEKKKKVRLQIQGEHTELDKAIADVIGEPLSHIIRNAIDHGIEPPEERSAAGKPGEGCVTLKAFHQGNRMVIEVEDDGRGIDVEMLKEKAVLKNIISVEEAQKMGPEEAVNLIFSAGFSTADNITETSGRGVGMNIVKEVVESLRGIIEVKTGKGCGTKTTLRLPLTLAIMKSVLFDCGGRVYALPLSSVSEISRVFPESVDTIAGRPVLRHRNTVVPLITVDGEMPLDKRFFVIFLAVAEMRAAVICDRIIGEEELVIKSLAERTSAGIVSGASILGNGGIVLILDPLYVIRKSLLPSDDVAGMQRVTA